MTEFFKKFKRDHVNTNHQGRSVSPIYEGKQFSKQKEAFKRLRDNILFYSLDGNKKVIEIVSSISFEAKTTLAINLAVSLSQSDKKVLIIDLDLKKPKVHRTFGFINSDGLVDYLLGKTDRSSMIKHTAYKNLDVINRGSSAPDSSVIFESKKFQDLIEQLKSTYDFIILDSSPILLTSDYIYISKVSDGAIFAVAYAATKKQQVNEALSLLKSINTPIIGAVFTFFDSKRSADYADYYYDYYNYYSYDGKDSQLK